MRDAVDARINEASKIAAEFRAFPNSGGIFAIAETLPGISSLITRTPRWRGEGVPMKRSFLPSTAACLMIAGTCLFMLQLKIASAVDARAKDPGVRLGPPAAGAALATLTPHEQEYFEAGRADFAEADGAAEGLGPRM